MKIKKFTCINCGAPKINEYKSPYIVCDYCGSFTDIDYTLGLGFWNASPEKTTRYSLRKFEFEKNLNKQKKSNDKIQYKLTQLEYWDYYYKCFPEYLPPSIDTPEKYNMYLDIAAESSTDSAFDKSENEKANQLALTQQKLKYYQDKGRNFVTSETFFPMADYYINYLKDSFKSFYSNPEYKIMYELLPPDVHLKMKLSMFVQIWLPYLNEEDTEKFLKDTGFNQQYVEMDKPSGNTISCEKCSHELFVPDGSYKIYCENCRHFTSVKQTFKCMSCGAENKVPENPSKTIDCEYCGTENRLIQPLFG